MNEYVQKHISHEWVIPVRRFYESLDFHRIFHLTKLHIPLSILHTMIIKLFDIDRD